MRRESPYRMVVMEKDEEMALFLEMSRREAEDDNLPALINSDELDESHLGFCPISKMEPSLHVPQTNADDFLNFENNTTDYDWLLTLPDIPLFPLLEMESKKHVFSQSEAITIQSTSLDTKPADIQDPTSGLEVSPPDYGSTKGGNKNQSAFKNLESVKGIHAAVKPSRSPTLSSQTSMLSSIKPKNSSTRSTTPGKSGSYLSIPVFRASSQVVSKSAPRSSTPICKNPSLTVGPCVSGPDHSSAVAKPTPSRSNKPVFAHNNVPIVKPSDPQHSHYVPLHSKTSLPEGSGSAPRGRRPGVSNHKMAYLRASSNGNRTQKSCSPSRVRAANSNGSSGRNFMRGWSGAHSNDADQVNPLKIGSQMVERVLNMRKLAPPKPDCHNGQNKTSEKSSSSRDHSGFGLSISKKSLDMAMRHMSIRECISGTLKPLNTKTGAVSGHSTPTGSIKSGTNLSNSPFAASSDGSSDHMVHFSSNYSDMNEMAVRESNPKIKI